MRRKASPTLGLIAASAILIATAPLAHATSLNTVTGNNTTGCSVNWEGISIFDRDKQVRPEDIASVYTGDLDALWKDRDGNPVAMENGGYIKEISGLFDDPGRFEIQHYPTGSNTVNFRYFLGTDHAINDAKLQVELPPLPEGATEWTFQASPWGATRYAPAVGLPYTVPVMPASATPDGTGVIELGDLPAFAGVTIIASANVPAANYNDTFIAKGTLTGTYADPEVCEPEPSEPSEPTTEPSEPTTKPSEPTTKPAWPTLPSLPPFPGQPVTPGNPGQPVTPGNPGQPVTPVPYTVQQGSPQQSQQAQPQKQRSGLANTGVSSMTLVWILVGLAAVAGGAALVLRRPRAER